MADVTLKIDGIEVRAPRGMFITGDTLTLADFSLGAALNLAEIAHFPIEPYAEIRRWHAGLRALPAWQKTLAQCALPAAAAA